MGPEAFAALAAKALGTESDGERARRNGQLRLA